MRKSFSSRHPTQHSTRRKSKRQFQPLLERLEDRWSPAILSFQGLISTGPVSPPDTVAAVSATNVVEAVNTSFQVYDKAGHVARGVQSFQALFNVPAGDTLSDPYVVFDDVAGRFVMGILEITTGANATSYYDLAVSNDATGANWTTYPRMINQGEAGEANGPFLADFPKIGFNADEIVVTSNQFYPLVNSTTLDHILVVSINAPNLFQAQPALNFFLHDEQLHASTDPTLFPAQMHGSAAGNPMYFVETGTNYNSMFVVSAANLLSANPNFSPYTPAIAVQQFQEINAIPNAVQQINAKVVSADWRNGNLVAAQTVGAADGLAHATWYEFAAAVVGNPIPPPTLVPGQDGMITIPGINTFYPSVALNANGDIGMTYMAYGGTGTIVPFSSMVVTSRLAGDPAGSMRPGPIVFAGNIANNSAPLRLGDYSATVTDPADGLTFWSANEYTWVSNPNNPPANTAFWATGIASFRTFAARDIIGQENGQFWLARSHGFDFENVAEQQFGQVGAGPWVNAMTGDFNGDGYDDIVAQDQPTGKWWVSLSNGPSGTFQTPQFWGMWSNRVNWSNPLVGDWDHSGRMGIAARDPASGWYYAATSDGTKFNLLNGGNGVTQYTTTLNWQFAVGDFKHNGYSDIVGMITNEKGVYPGQWWVAISNGTVFTNTNWSGQGWSSAVNWGNVLVGDFNGDGFTDVAARDQDSGYYYVATSDGTKFNLLNGGSGVTSYAGTLSWSFAVGDFNGDGKMDIVGFENGGVNDPYNGQWWTSISSGSSFTESLWASWDSSVTWVNPLVGDFTGDGVTDVVARDQAAGQWQWWVGISTGSPGSTTGTFPKGSVPWTTWSTGVTWINIMTGHYTTGIKGISGGILAPVRRSSIVNPTFASPAIEAGSSSGVTTSGSSERVPSATFVAPWNGSSWNDSRQTDKTPNSASPSLLGPQPRKSIWEIWEPTPWDFLG